MVKCGEVVAFKKKFGDKQKHPDKSAVFFLLVGLLLGYAASCLSTN
jgi:hypothetical protein